MSTRILSTRNVSFVLVGCVVTPAPIRPCVPPGFHSEEPDRPKVCPDCYFFPYIFFLKKAHKKKAVTQTT